MASSLFPRNNNGNLISQLSNFRQLINGNPQELYNQMYNSNPQFRQFADSMQGKTPEQAFSENGLNFNQIKSMI